MARRPFRSLATGCRALVVLVVVVAGLQLVPVAASAAPVAGTLAATPDPPTVSEQVELTGSLPPARPRPVTLERRTGTGAWTQVGSGRTTADGSVEFSVTMPGTVGTTVSYRVQAAEVRRNGTVLPAVQTPDVDLTTVAQGATLVVPASVAAGSSFEAVADFFPDRPGRQVVLQRRSGNRWAAVATTTQDASGIARFVVPAGSATGPQTFRAVAKKDDGAPRVISPSGAVTVTTEDDTTPPAVPVALAAVPGDSSAALSWDEVGDTDLAGYRVHRAPAATGPWTLAASPTGTTHEEPGLTNGSTYWFAVSAVDADGNESARSDAVSVTPVDSTPPTVPSGLVATAGDGSVSLAWDEVADATGYVVAQGTSADGPWTTAGSPSSESLEVGGLTNGTPYWFTVSAVDAAGNGSAPSAPVSATPVDLTPPPAVTLLSATPHDRSVVLVWEESTAADLASYRIEWAGAADGPFTVAVPEITDTTYTFTGLTNGTTRWYRIVGVDADGNASDPSEALAATPFDDAPPGVPAPVSAIPHDRSVELSWGGQYGGDTAGFNVWISDSADGPWSLVDDSPVASPPLTIDGLTNGVTYWFSVSSLDTSGNESARSTAASATPADDVPPPVPTGVTAVATPGKVTVSWDAVVDESLVDYVLTRATSADGPWERLEWNTSTTTTFEDTDVVPETAYWYTVQSVDAAGNWSLPSEPAQVTAADATPPAVPTGLVATAGDREVLLEWDAVADADLAGYRVHQSSSAEGPWAPVGSTVTGTSTTVIDLQNGTEHWFTVSAVDSAGNESAPSSADSATPMPTPQRPEVLAPGNQLTCEVRTDRSLWCWGVGALGQPGTSYITWSSTPVRVGTGTDWSGVTVGSGHTCGTKVDGTAWCWGSNQDGQVGDGTTSSRSVPTQVGTATDWVVVDAGASHTCGLRSDHSLWCWGQGQYGQLGTGSTVDELLPRQLVGSWARLAAGSLRTCAVGTDGSAWCWGRHHGGFGTQDLVPVQVGEDHDWTAVSAGSDHSCGIRAAGTAWCWGSNESGQVGDGTTVRRTGPVQVGTATTWATLSAGGLSTCGTQVDGTAWCWGQNQYGQLGDGTTVNRLTPTRLGPESDWTSVAVGHVHACGLRSGASSYCWGYVGDGRLGTGRTENEPSPRRIDAAPAWIDLSTGNQHGCGIQADRSLWCWGQNGYGQLGDGTSSNRFVPTRAGAATDWAAVSAGGNLTCATRVDASLWCWGSNASGEVGDGTTTDRRLPTRVGTGTDWTSVAAGGGHACGARADGTIWCWGANDAGELGDGTTTARSTPQQVGTDSDWTTVTAGVGHTCGTRADGSAWCWGGNFTGQLGDGTTSARSTPTRVGTGTDWTGLSAGWNHTCGSRTDGSLWCWGYNSSGQIGDGTTSGRLTPTRTGSGTDWSAVLAGGGQTCASKTDSSLWCWGQNNNGQVGDGSTTTRLTPTPVAGSWASFTVGSSQSCATGSDGSAWCWGWNNVGQLGIAPIESSPQPVAY